jgi:hypothetical protein
LEFVSVPLFDQFSSTLGRRLHQMTKTIFQRVIPRLLMLAIPLFLTACTSTLREAFLNPNEDPFTARFWSTPQRGEDYPEMQDAGIRRRASFGVAFQGGGNRAAPAALGQIRALHELGWMNDVRYVSAISGGSWTAIPYTYLKNGATDQASANAEATFLGRTYNPEEVARYVAFLSRYPNHPSAQALFPRGSMLGAISDSSVSHRMIAAWLRRRFDEAYAATLEDIYLAPFGLGRVDPSEPDSLFTWRTDDETSLRQSGRDFSSIKVHTVERDRPYLIVGGTLLTQRTNIKPDKKFRTEMTPLYSGMPYAWPNGENAHRVGGGFVESYGYDYVTKDVRRNGGTTELVLTNPPYGNRSDPWRLNFSLANVAAVSGAAPVETIVTAAPTAIVLANFGFPEHFVPIDKPFKNEWAHGDGGHEDNLGLSPLLARQVENIIVFANAFAPINRGAIGLCRERVRKLTTLPHDPKELPKCVTDMIGENIASFFLETKSLAHNDSLRMRENGSRYRGHPLRKLHDLIALAEDLRDDRVSCKRYDYNPSKEMLGVPYSPVICFVYLGLEGEWIGRVMAAVPEGADQKAIMTALEVDAYGNPKKPHPSRSVFGSSGFPHLKTFFDKPLRFIKTDRSRLFALSNLTAWTLHHRQQVIRQSFRENGLHLH